MTLPHTDKELIYAQLTLQPLRTPNHEWLACMLASWCAGDSALPDNLGLTDSDFAELNAYYFADYAVPRHAQSGKSVDFARMLERQDLIDLLSRYSRPYIVEMDWIIGILVAACLGDDHLWYDMGLWSRTQLTALLHYNFPELATRNSHDMKWKKFLYKQLCEEEGLFVCRAPSCAVCVDYAKCYGSEETLIDTASPLNDNGSYLIDSCE